MGVHGMRRFKGFGSLLIVCAIGVFGCGDDNNDPPPTAPDGSDQIVLTLANFGEASPSHYALWANGSGGAELLLRFSVVDDAPIGLDGEPASATDQSRALAGSSGFTITLEDDTTLSAPAGPALVAGTLSDLSAILTVENGGALGVDLTGAAGSMLLDAPTTTDPHDCERGIWFTDGAGAPSLALPTLSSGWRYESWVIDRTSDMVYSTGRFAGATGMDSDGAGSTSGDEQAGYNFPGQDFAVEAGGIPPLDLDNGLFGVSITVEPDPDNSPDPFSFTILGRNVATGTVEFDFSNLPPLVEGSGAFYEAWVAYDDDSLLTLGAFYWTGMRMIDPATGKDILGLPARCSMEGASGVRVSVEREGDDDPRPSGSFILAGDLQVGSVALSHKHKDAFGDSIGPPWISYILEGATTIDTSDFESGIWFYVVDEFGDSLSTLNLPPAPSGWVYQGWIDVGGIDGWISLGTFANSLGADSDSSGPWAADSIEYLPAFPGQDFIAGDGARNLVDGSTEAVVTIEPADDHAPDDPFIELYRDRINTRNRNETQDMDGILDLLPVSPTTFDATRVYALQSNGDRLPQATVHIAR